MRPRINTKFGKLTREELFTHLFDNNVYGLKVKRISEDLLEYTFCMMFRSTREKPEEIHIEVSRKSKFVLSAWTDKRKFETKEQLIKYTTR